MVQPSRSPLHAAESILWAIENRVHMQGTASCTGGSSISSRHLRRSMHLMRRYTLIHMAESRSAQP